MAAQTVLAISPINSGVFNRLFRHQVTEWGADGAPLKGTVGVTWAVNCDLRVLLAGCETAEARTMKIGSLLRPASGEDWWTGLQQVRVDELTPRGPEMLNTFWEFCAQPNGTLFIIKKGTVGLWVAKKTSSYQFLPGSQETKEKGLFQHRVGFEVVRPCIGSEREIPHGWPTIVEHHVLPMEDAAEAVVPEDQLEEDERTPAPAPAPVPGGVPGAEEAPVEVVEEAPVPARRQRQVFKCELYARTEATVQGVCEAILSGALKSPTRTVSWGKRAKHFPQAAMPTDILALFTEAEPVRGFLGICESFPEISKEEVGHFLRELVKQGLLCAA